ncbi:SDR family NAD(P)-dependent oxidoreductase [Streptomyces sp. NPDC003379]
MHHPSRGVAQVLTPVPAPPPRRHDEPTREPGTPVTVVTGSGSGIGIGRSTAVRLAAQGRDARITWRTGEDGGRQTAEEVRGRGRRAAVAHLEVTRLPEAADVVDEPTRNPAASTYWRTTYGTGTATPFLDMTYDAARDVLDVDLVVPFLCSQAAARRSGALLRGQGRTRGYSHRS